MYTPHIIMYVYLDYNWMVFNIDGAGNHKEIAYYMVYDFQKCHLIRCLR